MNPNRLSRRDFIISITSAFAATLTSTAIQADSESEYLRFSAWGTDKRAQLTAKALALFENTHPSVRIKSNFTDWLDYWRKLSTDAALGQTPDLIQMDFRYLAEYAHSGILEPLDPFLGNLLDLESFGANNIDACRVDGQLYGVNLGINSLAAFYEIQRWQKMEVEPPALGDSWDTFRDKCLQFASANSYENYYPVMDCSGLETVFECWLLQRGKFLYHTDGSLGFAVSDVVEWFDFWAELRSKQGCIPADIQVLFKNSIETSPITMGYSAMDFGHSNMMQNYQDLNKHQLGITACPTLPDGEPGNYYKPSQMLSISADLKADRLRKVVELANFLVMDPRAVLVLGLDRGIPASAKMRRELAPKLNQTGKSTLAFIESLKPYTRPLPPLPPFGAGEVAIVLQRISHEIAYGVLTPEQGGQQFIDESASILAR